VLGEQAGGVEPGARRSVVRAHLGSPTAIDALDPGRRERYRHLRLDVHYVKDRVQAVTTRSSDDVARNGIRVGLSRNRLSRLLQDETCTGEPSDEIRCVLRPGKRRGLHPTTFILRTGRLAAIRIEREPSDVEPPAPAPTSEPASENRGADEIWTVPPSVSALGARLLLDHRNET
jgi:hypothetical protein